MSATLLTGVMAEANFSELSLSSVLLPVVLIVVVIMTVGIFSMVLKWYKKVEQGTALIRNGMGGTRVSFSGMLVVPVLHRMEMMEISVKRVEIDRMGKNGLICKDNMRADVKVAFFVQVNKTPHDSLKVAQSLGCARASDPIALIEFFDAKFSEALKTVGKQFDFVELYNNRQRFKEEILKVIGTDLNGYVLDDAAIDYLEQTSLDHLDPNNILDADGIKKITDLTSKQAVLANAISRDKQKIIKKQDVEAREAILELERQQAEAEQKQAREVAEITAHQQAEALKVQQEERLKAERARISTDEELGVAEENKQRQIIVAAKNKERTDAVETERVGKEQGLEATERQRTVELAQIEKDKALEVEKRNIQEVIRERVTVERSVVEQEEKIKDTKEFAGADRVKQVAMTHAEKAGEEQKIQVLKAAEAAKEAADFHAKEEVIRAEGRRAAAEKDADARKIAADASAQEEAIKGMGEARALEAKAQANEKYGMSEANIIEKKAIAEAKGLEANAQATEKQGTAEASVMKLKFHAEADGIEKKSVAEAKGLEAKAVATEKQGGAEAEVMKQKLLAEADGIKEKAEAMKLYDEVGKEHEEFKLRLNKDLEIALTEIRIQEEIAKAQASLVGEALKSANIDIVGGDNTFFEKIVSSITTGKMVDRAVSSSDVLEDVKNSLIGSGNGGNGKGRLGEELQKLIGQFGIDTEDVKNLTISALLAKMTTLSDSDHTLDSLGRLSQIAREFGVAGEKTAKVLGLSK